MQNKLLSITRNIIPYVKELRPIAGSVTSVLLWQQLDYWFAKNPDGFYKFLSPPQTNHEKYRIGDSWTEELGFTKFEFRNAFDKIGVRHTSKGSFKKSLNPFVKNGKEMFFCSYHDKMKGITFYFRNHTLADNALDSLVKSEPYPVSKQSEFTEVDKVNLPKATLSTSTIYTETTTENNNIKLVDDDNFEKIFSTEEQPAAKKVLSKIPTQKQVEVLAVLLVMIKTSTINNKVGYLRAIVKSVNEGTFTPIPEKLKPLSTQERINEEEKKRKQETERLKVDNNAYFAEIEAKYGYVAKS
ncbi:MAG: hypothetical protein GXO84_09700 [Chlorobi bacterium]|nr:hypothetical protein [Chlorobiota bacterium]